MVTHALLITSSRGYGCPPLQGERRNKLHDSETSVHWKAGLPPAKSSSWLWILLRTWRDSSNRSKRLGTALPPWLVNLNCCRLGLSLQQLQICFSCPLPGNAETVWRDWVSRGWRRDGGTGSALPPLQWGYSPLEKWEFCPMGFLPKPLIGKVSLEAMQGLCCTSIPPKSFQMSDFSLHGL